MYHQPWIQTRWRFCTRGRTAINEGVGLGLMIRHLLWHWVPYKNEGTVIVLMTSKTNENLVASAYDLCSIAGRGGYRVKPGGARQSGRLARLFTINTDIVVTISVGRLVISPLGKSKGRANLFREWVISCLNCVSLDWSHRRWHSIAGLLLYHNRSQISNPSWLDVTSCSHTHFCLKIKKDVCAFLYGKISLISTSW